MSAIGINIFILMLFPKIENKTSVNIKITAIIPKIEMAFGLNLDTYNA